jgi:hypothetical protein
MTRRKSNQKGRRRQSWLLAYAKERINLNLLPYPGTIFFNSDQIFQRDDGLYDSGVNQSLLQHVFHPKHYNQLLACCHRVIFVCMRQQV